MRSNLTLTLIIIIIVSSGAYSQDNLITLNETNTEVKEILGKIENQSNIRFFYSEDLLNLNNRIDVSYTNTPLNEVIENILSDLDLIYKIFNENLVVISSKEFSLYPIKVSGRITDKYNFPLPGVNIFNKSTNNGTISDLDGFYSIIVHSEEDILSFSYVGFLSIDKEVSDQSVINVILYEDVKTFDEVVVIGYGTQKKKDITGAVASVPKERFRQLPNNNLAEVMRGSLPGIIIKQNAASAEEDNQTILIRGRNSILADNSPLIVLDGMPYLGRISEINPTDIASIDILKDASSAAIYGSRGANGVILISTKQGKKGKPRLSYDGYFGLQAVSDYPKPLTGPEFYEFKKIRDPNSITPSEEANYQNGIWTNYPELVLNTGFRQQHTLTLSGATETFNYYISGSFLNVDGITMNDRFGRFSFRNKMKVKLNNWLTISSNTSLVNSDRSGIAPSWRHVWVSNPLTVPYDEMGNISIYNWPEQPDNTNPLNWKLVHNTDITYKVISNNYLDLTIPFISGFSYKLNTGVIYRFDKADIYWPRTTKRGFEAGGSASASSQNTTRWLFEHIFDYSKSFQNHNIFLTALYSAQEDNWQSRSISGNGFPNDLLATYQLNVAAKLSSSDDYRREALVSQMLRMNYNYDNRYLFTLTGRRDGFSGFGQNNKYGFFPSLAMGWVVSEESWFTNRLSLSDLKLRVSYGKSGNHAVGPYETLSRMEENSYLDGSITAPGYFPFKLGTPDLGWESSTSLNVGIDFSILKNRIQGSLDIYSTKTNDLLLNRSISSVHGISHITQNVGKTKNQGIEILINSSNIVTSEFNWVSKINFSYNHNQILDLYGTKQDDLGNEWFIGYPIRVVFRNEFDGVFQEGDDIKNSAQPDAQPGYAKVVDQNEDGKIDAEDRIIHGQLDPKINWGINNTLSYKGFSFYFLVYGLHGHVDANDLLVDYVWGDVRLNTTRKDWWTPENPTNEYYKNEVGANSYTTRIVEKKGFVRIKDVSLSFTLPSDLLSRLKLINAKIYLTARNLGVFTNWTGWDPELEWAGDNPPVPRQPMQREYLIGFTVDF